MYIHIYKRLQISSIVIVRYISTKRVLTVACRDTNAIVLFVLPPCMPSNNNACDVPPPPDLHSRPGKWKVRDRHGMVDC